jgi:hypothetical protein
MVALQIKVGPLSKKVWVSPLIPGVPGRATFLLPISI